MKIMHFIPVYAPAWEFGGPVKSVSRMCEALAKTKHDIEVITTNAGIRDLASLTKPIVIDRNGVKVSYYPIKKSSGYIESPMLRNALPEALQSADVLHLSTIWQPLGIPVQKAAYKLGIPTLQSLRGALSPYSFSQKYWKKKIYYLLQEKQWLQKTNGLHVTSMHEYYETERLMLKPPIYKLENPIDLNNFYIDEDLGHLWREKNGIDAETPIFLVCGRIHHKKGLELIPEILGLIELVRWRLIIIGKDEDGSGERLKAAIRAKGLMGRVSYLDFAEEKELNEIYNAADLLLVPSRHENFGNVVIEALACGCQVLTSDSTGVSCDLNMMKAGNFGAVLPRNSHDWAMWISAWLKTPKQRAYETSRWVKANYNSQSLADKAIDIYKQIIEHK